MMTKLIAFAKKWTLPLGMLVGVAVYLMFHFFTFLSPLKAVVTEISHYIMPFFIFVMLFAIWVAYTYLSPVISIAPSSYILFQNIVNSWQLWQRETGRL